MQADLYSKVFWGGLWGFLFLLPLRKVVASWWVRTLIFGARQNFRKAPCTSALTSSTWLHLC